MSGKSREEFEEWLSNYVQQEPKNLKLFMYKLLTVKEAWQEQQKKIDELEAENPREECIECGGAGFIIEGGAEHHPQCNGDCNIYGCPVDGRYQTLCPSCQGIGKISKVKEQDIIIKELQSQLIEANKRIERMIEEER